jgi:hypothetical protein
MGRALRSPFGIRSSAVLGLLCGLLIREAAYGQGGAPGAISARSHSGQFIIHAAPSSGPPAGLEQLATNRNYIFLEPKLVPTSCERIKQILLRELRAPDAWRGKIFLALHPAAGADEAVTLISEQFRDGWQYQADLPNVVERTRYVRAIVQVLLLEMANRNANGHSAEIPSWLIEGLTRQLLASNEIEIILPPPPKGANGISFAMTHISARRENPLETAHQVLLARPGLTFEELSWPGPNELSGAAGEVYGSSAQLFVNGLLQLRDGPACLRAMLEELPRHYNWQFAFLHAFHAYFQRPLEVEKWWALLLAHFTGRDLAETWPTDESRQKLDEIIRSTVEIRTGTNELPLRAEVSLQTVVLKWDREPQTQMLLGKIRDLEMLRLRVAPDQVGLVDDYRQVLQNYLLDRDHTGFIPFRKGIVRRHAAERAVEQLDMLDARRMAMAEAENRKSQQAATKSESNPASEGRPGKTGR